MRPIRDQMHLADCPRELPSGAIMLVDPSAAPGVQHALVGKTLHGYNIVISECYEYLVGEVLASFSFQQRPKRKPGSKGRVEIEINMEGERSTVTFDRDELPAVMVYELTFLCWKPPLRDARTACQSSTEVRTSQSEYHYSSFRG